VEEFSKVTVFTAQSLLGCKIVKLATGLGLTVIKTVNVKGLPATIPE
jgi:hypothetical protein